MNKNNSKNVMEEEGMLQAAAPEMEKESTVKDNNSRIPFKCTLHGTSICEDPTCSGFDDRKCDFWRRHSSK